MGKREQRDRGGVAVVGCEQPAPDTDRVDLLEERRRAEC
jgi:hypothetical protein